MNKFEASNDHPIHQALIKGDAEAVDRYLKEGVDPYLNGVLAGGIHGGNLAVMDALMANGVDVERPFREGGWRPLMKAVEARQMTVIKYLIEKGADINGGLGLGATPLHFAVNCFPESIRFLLEHGALVDAQDSHGITPFIQAACKNMIQEMELLHAHGADIEASLHDGNTAFMGTVRGGSEEAMHWLISHGANIHVRDKRGRSAVWWALECGRPELAEFLRGLSVQG